MRLVLQSGCAPLEERAGVCAASDGAIPRDSALANKEKNGTVIVRKFVRG